MYGGDRNQTKMKAKYEIVRPAESDMILTPDMAIDRGEWYSEN